MKKQLGPKAKYNRFFKLFWEKASLDNLVKNTKGGYFTNVRVDDFSVITEIEEFCKKNQIKIIKNRIDRRVIYLVF